MRRIGLAAAAAWPARAHEGRAFEPHDLLTEWVWDPWIVLPLLVTALLYARGAKAGRGFTRLERHCFWWGWAVLVIALISPLHPMGEALFWAHMTQHELLMVIAAPLLILSRPHIAFLWALRPEHRRPAAAWTATGWWGALWGFVSRPLPAFAIHFAAIWVWHIPAAYGATVSSALLHSLQHASFLGTALLFWWTTLRPAAARRERGAALFYIFATAVHTSILGALLAFSNTPWYPVYAETTAEWGLTPLEDQQLGGVIMWVPPGFVYLVIFLAIFARWIQGSRVERYARAAPALLAILFASSCAYGPQLEIPADGLVPGADPKQGVQLLSAYGCASCPRIPGVPGAVGNVGPPLDGVGSRTYLAGRIANTPENMIRWIHDPKSVDSQTAMPRTGISAEQARHVTRYLYTLR